MRGAKLVSVGNADIEVVAVLVDFQDLASAQRIRGISHERNDISIRSRQSRDGRRYGFVICYDLSVSSSLSFRIAARNVPHRGRYHVSQCAEVFIFIETRKYHVAIAALDFVTDGVAPIVLAEVGSYVRGANVDIDRRAGEIIAHERGDNSRPDFQGGIGDFVAGEIVERPEDSDIGAVELGVYYICVHGVVCIDARGALRVEFAVDDVDRVRCVSVDHAILATLKGYVIKPPGLGIETRQSASQHQIKI